MATTLILPFQVFGVEKIIINNISLDDFTKSPLMENEAGDLTLIEKDKYKFYFYPSENYFYLGLFETQSFKSAVSEIRKFLSLDFNNLCKLPIKVSSFANEENIQLCYSPLFVDFDNNGKLTGDDLAIWINQYKKSTKTDVNEFIDVNLDNSINALDYSLIYELIFQNNST